MPPSIQTAMARLRGTVTRRRSGFVDELFVDMRPGAADNDPWDPRRIAFPPSLEVLRIHQLGFARCSKHALNPLHPLGRTRWVDAGSQTKSCPLVRP